MAEEKTINEQTQATTVAAPKSKKKMMIILLSALILLGGGGVGGFMYMKHQKALAAETEEDSAEVKESAPEKSYFTAFERTVGNLPPRPDDPEQIQRYLAFKLNMEFYDNEDKNVRDKLVGDVKPKIINAIIMTIPEFNASNILTVDGKTKFTERIKDKTEAIIVESANNYHIKLKDKKHTIKSVLLEEVLVQ